MSIRKKGILSINDLASPNERVLDVFDYREPTSFEEDPKIYLETPSQMIDHLEDFENLNVSEYRQVQPTEQYLEVEVPSNELLARFDHEKNVIIKNSLMPQPVDSGFFNAQLTTLNEIGFNNYLFSTNRSHFPILDQNSSENKIINRQTRLTAPILPEIGDNGIQKNDEVTQLENDQIRIPNDQILIEEEIKIEVQDEESPIFLHPKKRFIYRNENSDQSLKEESKRKIIPDNESMSYHFSIDNNDDSEKANGSNIDFTNQIQNITQKKQNPLQNEQDITESLEIDSSLLSKQSDQIQQNLKNTPTIHEVKIDKKQSVPSFMIKQPEFNYGQTSMFIFYKGCYLRDIIIHIIESRYFEFLMILTIFMNSITLSFYDYSDRDSLSQGNQLIDQMNTGFTIIFIAEAGLKIIAMGLILHKNAYLRNGWNIIDAVVVFSGPLKTINALPGMKKLISALIGSIPDFANVVIFLIFIFIMFATVGLHQYNGAFFNACRETEEPVNSTYWAINVDDYRLCTISGLGNYKCPINFTCGNPADYPDYDVTYENMEIRGFVNFGITNFNNIGTSLLTVFQIITSDTWYQQICNLMDVDISLFSFVYCLSIIIVGQFFLMNLFLAVIVFAFIKSQKLEIQNEVLKLKKEQDLIDQNENKAKEIQIAPKNQKSLMQKWDKEFAKSKSKIFKKQATYFKQNQKQSSGEIIPQYELKQILRSESEQRISQSNKLEIRTPSVLPQNQEFLTFLRPQIQKKKIVSILLEKYQEKQRRKMIQDNDEQMNEDSKRNLMNFEDEQQDIDLDDIEVQPVQPVASHLLSRIFNQKVFEDDSFSVKKEEKIEVQQTEDMKNKIGMLIRKKIEREYQKYFDQTIDETLQSKNTQKANMRELVGIKVGLEFLIKQKTLIEQEKLEMKQISSRKRQNKMYKIAFEISESFYFQWFVALSIVANTIVLSLDSYPQNIQMALILEKLNIAFSLIFLLEIGIKFTAFGFKNFLKGSWMNSFDCIIVIASLFDMILSNLFIQDEKLTNGSIFTVLRGFRLLRIFKLAKTWKRLELLLETMGESLKDIANFAIFMSIFIFIFTLLGLELFAYKAQINLDTMEVDTINGKSPTVNFDNFLNSFSLVFIILTNDGQSAVYYNYYRTAGAAAATIYFVILVLVGQKVIINLFVAILLENFDEGALKQKLHDYGEQQILQGEGQKLNCFKVFVNDKVKPFISRCRHSKDSDGKLETQNNLNASLYYFTEENSFRKNVKTIVKNKRFEQFIILIIIISAILLAIDDPLDDPHSYKQFLIFWIDCATTIIFILEALLKIVADGFIFNGDQSYLHQPWNKLDFLIIIFSILSQTPLPNEFKVFKVLRIFRLISRNEGLKVAVRALFRALPNIANVTLIMMLFFLIFGVIAVSQFKGKFFDCVDNIETQEDINSKWDCLNSGGLWQNHVYTFDDVPNAFITLFVMSTTAGWQDVLINSITSTEIDYLPGTYRSPFWSAFFIIFMIIGYLFFLNLFIGVVVTTFANEQDKLGGNDLLTEKQREWIELKLLVLRCAPIKKIKPPDNKFQIFFYKIMVHPNFDDFIFLCIVLNAIILTMKWHGQNYPTEIAFETINYIFTIIFILEAFIKIIGQGLKSYFADGWNLFDFVIAVGSISSILISALSALSLKGAVSLVRSIRVLRILRLLKRGGRNLYMIFNTFVITFKSLINIGSLLLLIIYTYAVVGMFIFGTNKRSGIMNAYINFESFINAFITLFTVTTGDSWNAIQTSFVVSNSPNSQCIFRPKYQDYLDNSMIPLGCSSKIASYAFFSSFTFIVSLIFLQLFIAVILEGFDSTQIQEARLFNNEMTQAFRRAWSEFDPQLRDFLALLGEPLGFFGETLNKRILQDKFIASLELPTYKNFTQYQFLDVLDALSFKLMVKDHLKQKISLSNKSDNETSNLENEIKEALSKEINQLIFQRKSEGITAVQDVMVKELKKGKQKLSMIDKEGLMSTHHMAAEAAIRRMREFIKQKRRQKIEKESECLTPKLKRRMKTVLLQKNRVSISQP